MLDITRGKPCAEQLNLSTELCNRIDKNELIIDGADWRNYGGLGGIPEAKALFGHYLGVDNNEIFIGGNSSLSLMYDAVAFSCLYSFAGENPWQPRNREVKFICLTPGYDRHFGICESLGIKMLSIPLIDGDLDMKAIESVVSTDESVKGIWCVPRYSNPTGICYSTKTVETLAGMKTKAPDFKIFWDDAYAVHHHGQGIHKIANILRACQEHENPDRVFLFGSTSKLTFPGAGVAFTGSSAKNIQRLTAIYGKKTIGFDKINQLRHVKFFSDMNGIREHADKHAAILKRKFAVIDKNLRAKVKRRMDWELPDGGYFMALNFPGQAKKIIERAKEKGLLLTPVGACFPYGNDPNDEVIRIAPTYLPDDDLEQAMAILCECINET